MGNFNIAFELVIANISPKMTFFYILKNNAIMIKINLYLNTFLYGLLLHFTDSNNSCEGCNCSGFADLLPKTYGSSTFLSSKRFNL